VTTKQPAVKRYIIKLSDEDRERLNTLIQKGKSPARQALKARILLKADASEADEAWSDGRIAEALDTSVDTMARTRQQLVEGGIDAALTRKHSPNSARRRIFDGAAEAKLIALACSPPPKGRKRWTLRHAASSSGSSGTTPPSMAVGWIWLHPNRVSCRANASTGGSLTSKP